MSMQHLWAPWRLEYIKNEDRSKKDTPCPFCELPKDGVNEETLIHYCDNELFVIQNKFPYNPGHLLIIPRAHQESPELLSNELSSKLALAQKRCIEILRKSMNPNGFNMGMNIGSSAGAGIPHHLHWHVLPRWSGDTNFMPLLAETKAIPTHNVTVYRQLHSLFADFSDSLILS